MELFLLFQAGVTALDFLNPLLALVAPFVTQFIKNQLKLSGNGAVLATLAVAFGLAIFGVWATTGLALASTAVLFTTIFTTATVVYKFFITNETVQAKLPETLQNK